MHTTTLVALTAGVFLTAGGLIALGQRFSSNPMTGVWVLYRSQILVTAWMIVPVWLGKPFFELAVLAMVGVTTWELFTTLGVLGVAPYRGLGMGGALGYAFLALFGQTRLLPWAPLLLALAMLIFSLFRQAGEHSYRRAACTLLGTLFPGMCLTFALRLPELGNGAGDFLFLYAVLEVNDAFAFVFGRYLGRHKLSRLSPNKTIEGAVGGIASAAVIASLLSGLLPDLRAWQCAGLGVVMGTCGMTADLVASAIKRQAGVKDFSSFAPPQGGMLDLYDAFIFCSPAWFLFLSWLRGPS